MKLDKEAILGIGLVLIGISIENLSITVIQAIFVGSGLLMLLKGWKE